MASPSPAKRRRLSLGPPINFNAQNTPLRRSTSRNDARTAPGRRESYMSPTRASLSRFNPHLLPQTQVKGDAGSRPGSRGSRPSSRGSATAISRRTTLPASSLSARNNDPQKVNGDATERDATSTPTHGANADLLQQQLTAGIEASLTTPSKSKRRSTGRRLSASPRTRPKPAGNRNNNILSRPRIPRTAPLGAATSQIQKQSGPRPAIRQEQDPAEPDTETTRGRDEEEIQSLDRTTRSEGIRKATEPSVPSVTKFQPQENPPRIPDGRPTRTALWGGRLRASKSPGTPASNGGKSTVASKTQERRPRLESAVEPDTDETASLTEKRQMRDGLLEEVRRLQKQVDRLERAVDRGQQDDAAPDPRHVKELISLLELDKDAATASKSAEPPPQSRSIAAFLPFSKRIRPGTLPAALHIPDTPPASHRPLDLPDQLPYLQAFTPLTITSSVSIPPQDLHDHARDLNQIHRTNLTSPSKLLSASLELTYNTATSTVMNLDITSLSPWAEQELGTWIRQRAKGQSVAGRDIAGICWAIGRYWEAAEKRARVWAECERQFAPHLSADTRRHGRPSPSTGQRRREDDEDDEDGEDDDSNDEVEDSQTYSASIPRRVLISHLGRSTLTFRNPQNTTVSKSQPAQLTVSWPITFDWTGEAQAQISARADLPRAWTDLDTLSSLRKIPELFSRLLRFRRGKGGSSDVEFTDAGYGDDDDGSGRALDDVDVVGAIQGILGLLYH